MDSLRKPSPIKQITFRARASGYAPASDSPALYDSASAPVKKSEGMRNKRKIFFGILALIFFASFSTALFFIYKSFATGRSIQISNTHASIFSDVKRLAVSYFTGRQFALKGEDAGRVNILLLGRAGEHYPGKNLTDTVILMSLDTRNRKVALLSLPRDLYAPIPDTALYTKINSLYQYGLGQGASVTPLREAVEEITGQTIHYFFILDFDGFEKIIDAQGGIAVDVLRDFHDPSYPGKNYSYETFDIQKGWQTLDGATALKYVRERHNDPEGDFGRAKRQQQVIQAVKNKAFSLGTFLNIFAISRLLDALGESVQTDMTLDEMERFIGLGKTLDTQNVSSVVIDAWQKESLLRVSHIQVGPTAAFILVPRVGNWSEIHDVSENIFRLDALQKNRARLAEEQATLTLLSTPENIASAEKMKQLALEMGWTQVSVVSLPTLKNRAQSIIIDRSDLRKPFSLNELMKKFSLEKENEMPSALNVADSSDFTIIIGNDLANQLSFDEESNATSIDDTAFSEILPPQPKK